MRNVNLNAGGVVGGLLGAGIAFAVIFSGDPGYERWMKRLVIGLVIVGALGGNLLWGLLTGKPRSDTDARVNRSTEEEDPGSCAICGAKLSNPGKGTRLCESCRRQTS